MQNWFVANASTPVTDDKRLVDVIATAPAVVPRQALSMPAVDEKVWCLSVLYGVHVHVYLSE